MDKRTENLRFLLWQNRELKKVDWLPTLRSWLDCTEDRAGALLSGEKVVSDEEQLRLLGIFDDEFSVQDFQVSQLVSVSGIDILAENIRFLTNESLGTSQRELSRLLGINQVTLSRWRSGEQKPHQSNLRLFVAHFGLPSHTDLRHDPLFLSPGPFGDLQKRNWLKARIDEITSGELQKLFPALERLLEK